MSTFCATFSYFGLSKDLFIKKNNTMCIKKTILNPCILLLCLCSVAACKKTATPTPTPPVVMPPVMPPAVVPITPSFSAARVDFKTIQFSNLTTTVADSCKWYFGDGDSAVVKGNAVVRHTYGSGGTYKVKLVALDTYKRQQGSVEKSFDILTSAKILGVQVDNIPPTVQRGMVTTSWDPSSGYPDIQIWLYVFNPMGTPKNNYTSDTTMEHQTTSIIKESKVFKSDGDITFNLDDKLMVVLYDLESSAGEQAQSGITQELMASTGQFLFQLNPLIDAKKGGLSVTTSGNPGYIKVLDGSTPISLLLEWQY